MLQKLSPYEILAADRWHSALFTTFSLSLSFFEAVPLHALRARGARNIGILTDIVGYRASLSEAGVADAGRTYDLVPVRLSTGYFFHPKIMILAGDDGPRAAVGSGNLTFGGWGHNVEVLEYLAPQQAPTAFGDLADFLLFLEIDLAPGGRLQSSGDFALGPMHDACNQAARASGDGRTRVIHSYNGPVSRQLAARVDELGGATEVTVVSPFFGSPAAVVELARTLRCDRVRVCVTGRAPEFFDFDAAEAAGLRATPVRSDAFEPNSMLHAKIIEVVCRRGRLILAGSVNATRAALTSDDNVEAAVLRIVPDALLFGWCPADKRSPAEGEGSAPPSGGACLAARFDGGKISGRMFGVSKPAGTWTGHLVSGPAQLPAGDVTVGDDGLFSLKPQHLHSLVRATQLVLAKDGAEVRGWLGFDQILAAVRERGPLAEAMIRLISGAGEPDDLAAILSFFVSNPEAFVHDEPEVPSGGDTTESAQGGANGSIQLSALRPAGAFENGSRIAGPSAGATAFEKLLGSLRRHVREAPRPKVALVDAGDADDGDAATIDIGVVPRWRIEEAIQALSDFVAELPPEKPELRPHIVDLLDFILFAADRSDDPDGLKVTYVPDWIRIARRHAALPDEADVLDKALVAVVGARVIDDPSEAPRMHVWLQGWCRGLVPPDWIESARPHAHGLREQRLRVGASPEAWDVALAQIMSSRTSWMKVEEVRAALAGAGALPELPAALADEITVLAKVAANQARGDRVVTLAYATKQPACPRCYRKLPGMAAQKLREHRIALTPCCDRVLMDPFLD
jgi:hypothetical protein